MRFLLETLVMSGLVSSNRTPIAVHDVSGIGMISKKHALITETDGKAPSLAVFHAGQWNRRSTTHHL